ncbi:polyprenyl synthetase family protein, partial [Neisseria sp. P0015.S006]
TCHVQYDEATALLVGDALQTQAFDVLSRPTDLPAERQLAMLSTLAQASGSLGMAGGQAIDLANIGKAMNQAELEQMHSLKTGALIRAAVALGALSCPDLTPAQIQTLDHYAAKLGLAFQVIDDVLDCEADTATLGKTAGKDSDNDKPTYVKLMGLQAARTYAETLIAETVSLIEPFGSKALRLRQLAEFVTARKN